MGTKAGAQALLVLAALAVIAAGIKLASHVLAPIVVAWCLAAVAVPAVRALKRRGVPEYAGIGLTMLGAGVVLVGFVGVLVVAAQDVGSSLPRLEASLLETRESLLRWLEARNIADAGSIVDQLALHRVDGAMVSSMFSGLHEFLVACSVVFFVLLFILVELPTFPGKLRRSLGWRSSRFVAARQVMREMQRYLVVKTWLSAAMGLFCGVFCWAVGVDYPVLWGLLTFLLNYIPVFGALVATIAPAGMALIDGGLGLALLVGAGLLFIHNLIGNIVEPAVLGRAIHLSPLVVVLSLVVWGWLLGPVGALLSVPLTAVVKFLFSISDDLCWVALLLGPDDELDDPSGSGQARRTTAALAEAPLS